MSRKLLRTATIATLAAIQVAVLAGTAHAGTISDQVRAAVRAKGTADVIITSANPTSSAPPATYLDNGANTDVNRTYDVVSATAAQVDAAALARLAADPKVGNVTLDTGAAPALATPPGYPAFQDIVKAPTAWGGGSTGKGRVVVVLDTGINSSSPHWGGRVIREACYTQGQCSGGRNTAFGAGSARVTDPRMNHGTLVTDVAAGPEGIAKDSKVIFIRVFTMTPDGPLAYWSDLLAALDHVYSLRNSYEIAAVNMSLGTTVVHGSTASCINGSTGAFEQTFGLLRSAGIMPVVSAGNSSSASGLSAPACHRNALSVGATTWEDKVTSFSNSHSSLDVLAPGQWLWSYDDIARSYGWFSGTSAAAPVIAGTIAVMNQDVRLADTQQVEAALESTGVSVRDTRNGVTKRRVDVSAARTKGRAQSIDGFTIASAPLLYMTTQSAFGYTITTYCRAGFAGRETSFILPTGYGPVCDAVQVAKTTVAGLPPVRYRYLKWNILGKVAYEEQAWVDRSLSVDTSANKRVLIENVNAFGYNIRTYCTRTAELDWQLTFATGYGPSCIARQVATTSLAGLPKKRVRIGFYNTGAKSFFETRGWVDIA